MKVLIFGQGLLLAHCVPIASVFREDYENCDVPTDYYQLTLCEVAQDNMPAVGTPERKQSYDELGWAYDETIPGYNRDASPIE